MKVVPAFANVAWLAASLPAWRQFRIALARPEETQWRILDGMLKNNAASVFGRDHGFGGMNSYEQFCRRVPVTDYDGLKRWIHRIMRAEPAMLTSEPVTRLLPTSGSAGGRKLIPFTAGLQRQFNRAIGAWMVDLSRSHPSVPCGPSYWSISPAVENVSDEKSAIPIGFDNDSAYLGGVLQRLVEATFAAPSALRLVKDPERFRYLTLLSLLRQRELSFVSVWHPSFLTLLLDALPAWWEKLLDDLERDGRRRARVLRKCRPEDIHAIWPKWRVASCWGDGQAALAATNLRARLPHLVLQPKGLLATEAFVSIPFQSQHPLAITSHFFEFAGDSGAVYPAHALQSGRRYEVIVTTAGGLWRYRLGDVVEVTSFIGKTPSLRFIARRAGVSDLCGEKLMDGFVTEVVQQLCDELGFQPSFAMLAPEFGEPDPPRYTLFLEGTAPAHLAAALDSELRRNPHYALCRDLGQLAAPRCFEIAGRAYEVFSNVRQSEGQRLGEIKPQMLSLRTDWRQHFSRRRSGPAV